MASRFDIGVVCRNGHEITPYGSDSGKRDTKFCPDCGETVIKECPECSTPIRGKYYVEGMISLIEWDAPSYCHECGKAYPWTTQRAEALADVIDELEELSDDERTKLKGSIPDIIADTPKSETAGFRFKKVFRKIGTTGGKLLENVLVKVATEAVKGQIGL